MTAGSISVAVDSTSSSSDWVAVAMPYTSSRRRQLQGPGPPAPEPAVVVSATEKLDIFLFKVTSGTTVSDSKRLTYSDSNCLAIRTLTNGKAYLIMYTGTTVVDLLYVDFNSNVHYKKS